MHADAPVISYCALGKVLLGLDEFMSLKGRVVHSMLCILIELGSQPAPSAVSLCSLLAIQSEL